MESRIPKILLYNLMRFSQQEIKEIEEVYLWTKLIQRGKKRNSGQPLTFHSLSVATRIAKDGYDATTISAALLHESQISQSATLEQIIDKFGKIIASIVDGVGKISAIKVKGKSYSSQETFLGQVDSYRKLLFAISSDIRILVVKLYDRLDNISTIEWIDPDKRKFYAQETIEVYAPIAERLGMGIVKGKLEDLAFPYAYPKEYDKFMSLAKSAYKNPHRVINREIPVIEKCLKQNNISFENVSGRAKHLFSLYNKVRSGKSLDNIFDIIAMRIIVHTVADCYKTLGIVHSIYQPLPGQIDDYIARPKDSGYQSLHTTVSNSTGDVFEIQIRTNEMHQVNEYGHAAHWSYKDRKSEKNTKLAEKNRIEWISELDKIKNIQTSKDFLAQLKEEFFARQIFVFTPKGKIIKLPINSTGLDFAYQIHSDIGNSCIGVKINDRLSPLSTTLKTGDVVEILTSKRASPSIDWLKIVKTVSAKHHIRLSLRQKNYQDLVSTGERIVNEALSKQRLDSFDRNKAEKAILESSLPYRDLASAYVAIAEGVLNKARLLKIIYSVANLAPKKTAKLYLPKQDKVILLPNIPHSFAGCCKPKPNDCNLIGYLGKEHLIKIHKANCKRICNADQRRLITL